jgi:uncharacterized membrane protein (DUF4010 family)
MDAASLDLPLRDFAIALFIGALVGIEREKKQETEPGRGIGGLRTFILVAEAGAVAAWLGIRLASPWVFVGVGALLAAVVVAGYLAWVRVQPAEVGLTTEVAAIVVYLLGGLATSGAPALAVALAIATSAILAFKQPLHGLVERIGREDLYAGLELLIAIFIVLPVLPDRPLDPWGALNPYRMGWLVVLISGLSLLGYIASRWVGTRRGLPIAGLLGGLVSSTVVTLDFARRSRDGAGDASLADALAAGLLGAWALMFARILVMVAVVNPSLLPALAAPMGVLGVVSGGFAAVHYARVRRLRPGAKELPLANPFGLGPAARFALLFAAVELAVHLVQRYAPGRGTFGVAALAGLTDVDAITLTMAGMARHATALATATTAITIAALTNSLVKWGITEAVGSSRLARPVRLATGALLVAAVLVLAFV